MNYINKYLKTIILMGGNYSDMYSTGKDGIDIRFRDKALFIPNRLINQAEDYANSIRMSFIREDYLWVMPNELRESIRYDEFIGRLQLLLQKGLI